LFYCYSRCLVTAAAAAATTTTALAFTFAFAFVSTIPWSSKFFRPVHCGVLIPVPVPLPLPLLLWWWVPSPFHKKKKRRYTTPHVPSHHITFHHVPSPPLWLPHTVHAMADIYIILQCCVGWWFRWWSYHPAPYHDTLNPLVGSA